MYAGALIKKPKDAPQIVKPAKDSKKKVKIEEEGSVSCNSSDDEENTIIIKPGALKTLTFDADSDVSGSSEEAKAPEIENISDNK